MTETMEKRTFTDDTLVTCLHGYGRVRAGERHYVDNTLFIDGIAKNVPYSTVRQWNLKAPAMKIFVLPVDADEADYAREVGIQPMEPQRLAAMLAASDMDSVFAALGEERALAVTRELGRRLGSKLSGESHAPRGRAAATAPTQ